MSPEFAWEEPLTCQVLRPWKKKKSAKPQTTDVHTIHSRGISLILSPLRSCRDNRERGRGQECEGLARLVPSLSLLRPPQCFPRLAGLGF